jgi:AcrR family transcriptional regulator
MAKKSPTAPRRRNAVATRAAILGSARLAFARAGYDGAGVREIAGGAGVTAMLVNRYFGSKEGLFAEVVAETMAAPSLITEKVIKSAAPGENLAAALIELTKPGSTPLDGFLIMLRSTASKPAAKIGREMIEKHHYKAMFAALSGDAAAERAALVLSLIAGFQMMRQMVGLTALAKAETSALRVVLGLLFQQLIANAPPCAK